MTAPPTEAVIAELRAAEQAATPGRGAFRTALTIRTQADAEFMVMLRDAAPALLAAAEAVERVRALCGRHPDAIATSVILRALPPAQPESPGGVL